MPKDTKTLGNSKARACESLGFVHKKGCARVLTHLQVTSYELPVHKLLCYKPESYYIVTYTHIPKATCSLYPVACHLIPYLKIPARLLHLFVSFVQYLIFSFYICAV